MGDFNTWGGAVRENAARDLKGARWRYWSLAAGGLFIVLWASDGSLDPGAYRVPFLVIAVGAWFGWRFTKAALLISARYEVMQDYLSEMGRANWDKEIL